MTWNLVFTRQAQKDARKLAASGLKPKAQELLAVIAEDPEGACSRRISIQHRLVYQVFEEEHVAKVLWLWSHYE